MNEANQSAPPISAEQWRIIVGRHAAPEMEPTWRRRHRRYPSRGSIVVHFRCVDGKPVRRSGSVIQVSVKGISARLRESVPAGCPLTLHMEIRGNQVVAEGLAKHCTETLGGYKVGIELQFPT